MKYEAPLGSGDPDAGYINRNLGTGTEGSKVPATAIEAPMREIVNVITEAGLTPDEDDNTQLYQAIQALLAGNNETGDVVGSYRTAKTGYYLLTDGCSIGDAASGATYAETAALNLYTLMWTNVSNTYAPVAGGRGGSAAADWAAHKKLTLPPWVGRTPVGAGTGSGLTNRPLGSFGGEEAHSLTSSENGSSTPTVQIPRGTATLSAGGGTGNYGIQAAGTGNSAPYADVYVSSSGSGTAHNVMQPYTAINWFIKK